MRRTLTPPRPYSRMLNWNARISSTEALDALFPARRAIEDTHPSLGERLARLGEDVNRLRRRRAQRVRRSSVAPSKPSPAGSTEEWLSRNGDAWHQHRAEYLEERGHARAAGGHRDAHRRTTSSSARSSSSRSSGQTSLCRFISAPPNRVTRRRGWPPVACCSIAGTRRALPWSRTRWIATSPGATRLPDPRGVLQRDPSSARGAKVRMARHPAHDPSASRAAWADPLKAVLESSFESAFQGGGNVQKTIETWVRK